MSDEKMPDITGLPFKKHFAIECETCHEALTFDDMDPAILKGLEDDLVVGFRKMSDVDKWSVVNFYKKHEAQGHKCGPCMIGLAPMPQA